MDQLLLSLRQLLNSNTLIGGAIPPLASIFQQLEALAALGYPYEDRTQSDGLLFQSPYWDNLDRVLVHRQVFGITQFDNRTQLLLSALGKDPYHFDTVKEYATFGLVAFPDHKPVYIAKDYKDPRKAIEVVKTYVKREDTTLVVRLGKPEKRPQFIVQSCFNPYFQYLRQNAQGLCVSPDLICNQAQMLNISLIHKDIRPMVSEIQKGFSPQVGLFIMPLKDGVSDCTVTELIAGFPYSTVQEYSPDSLESKPAGPGNFEL